jgi:hypothetical protein
MFSKLILKEGILMRIGYSGDELAKLGLLNYSAALGESSKEIMKDPALNWLMDQAFLQKFSEIEALVLAAAAMIEQNNQLVQKQLEDLGVLPRQE